MTGFSFSLVHGMAHTLGTALIIAVSLSFSPALYALEKNGFELADALVAESQIFKGGPAKDGIPAIDRPDFVSVDRADFMQPDDSVLGIEIAGIAKAYPIKILNWHEIVNDRIGREYFSVTFCPLCGTGVAFSARVDDTQLNFGVSGLLYNSDVLLYDRNTESLWSQIMAQAISGEYKGTHLKMLPLTHTHWKHWIQAHPDTKVLSIHTGYLRKYDKDPYRDYVTSKHLMFPVYHRAPNSYHPKERVMGIEVDGAYKAYPFAELNKHGAALIQDRINNIDIQLHWNQVQQSGFFTRAEGVPLPHIQGFWFAWFAFHPQTLVFKASAE